MTAPGIQARRAAAGAALVLALALSGCSTLGKVASSKETFAYCQAADAVTTYAALSSGFIEANPAMAGLLGHGWLPFLVVKAALVWAIYKIDLPPAAQTAVNVLACAPAVSNAVLLAR
jgi:hypothetical protein